MSRPILLVEDDRAIARVIALTLQSEGFEVRTAADGKAGLEELSSGQFALLLLDLSLPVMDGWTLFREARGLGICVPTVIVSAHGAQAACRELGAEGSIEKPFHPDELVLKVRQVIQEAG